MHPRLCDYKLLRSLIAFYHLVCIAVSGMDRTLIEVNWSTAQTHGIEGRGGGLGGQESGRCLNLKKLKQQD